jgi:LysR family transcriptional regulator (chromosome initiation inhibitor)
MLDYRLLEALYAVIQEGGFDKAASVLHVTQSAVSQRIRQLEDQTGQVLLMRTTPPRPTSAGRQILKHYLQVRQLESDLKNDLTPDPEITWGTLSIGLNADSLATWFTDAVRSFLEETPALIDLRVDDQDQTHQFLRDGEVLGCISSREKPVQGCSVTPLGCMDYRLLATPNFAKRWFSNGLKRRNMQKAPAVIFNRKDDLHRAMLHKLFGRDIPICPAHYVPSSEQFALTIASGLAYGMLPDQQSHEMIQTLRLIDLAPEVVVSVDLYWHCWNIHSGLIDALTRCLVKGAQRSLRSVQPMSGAPLT